MFKKKCGQCGRKVDKGYDYCPYCGFNNKREREIKEFGLLGREDNLGINEFFNMPLNITGFNRIFSSLLKQFKDLDKQIPEDVSKTRIRKLPASGISISISTSLGREPQIKIKGLGDKKVEQVKEANFISQISDEKARKFAKLPKKEARTIVRRLANKLVYELDLPGVKEIKDVIINKLENSIEVKAFSKDIVYFKLIPLNLPILKYILDKGKLTLELRPESI